MKETSYTIRSIPLALWAKVKALATIESKTLNQFIIETLQEKTERKKS